MRTLLLALLLASGLAHAEHRVSYASATVQSFTSTTTTTNTASEQTLIVITAAQPMIIHALYMDLTNVTNATLIIKVYKTKSGGSAVLRGLSGLLTGLLTWTVATDAKGLGVLTTPMALAAGDTLTVKGILATGEAKAIPYDYVWTQ